MILPFEAIHQYRLSTFRMLPGSRVQSQEQAVEYVNERGFVYFWPIKDALFPSLWTAVAGDRPVADAHDDPGHITWGWKDSLLGGQAWYYAKVLRKRATMIALDVAPYFYALTENYGVPEEDHLILYEQGKLTLEAKVVYEAILDHGPIDTIALRKKANLTSPDSESRFNKALADLQADFKIVPVAVTQAGAWRYAFAYDITARHYPQLPEQARFIGERDARRVLADRFFHSLGAARAGDLARLMGWKLQEATRTVEDLAGAGVLHNGLKFENQSGEWAALTSLIQLSDG